MSTTEATLPPADHPILTLAAAKQIVHLCKKQSMPDGCLRVMVKGGGCSGFEYEFDFSSYEPREGDILIKEGEATAVVDQVSLPFMSKSVIDFEDTLTRSGFTIDNPDATSSCGCGHSFSFDVSKLM